MCLRARVCFEKVNRKNYYIYNLFGMEKTPQKIEGWNKEFLSSLFTRSSPSAEISSLFERRE